MTLPKAYMDPVAYFEDCFRFFSEYQYLYKYPNTDILTANVLDDIEVGAQDLLDIFDPNFDIERVSSKYLQAFFEKSNPLIPACYEDFQEDSTIDFVIDAPLSTKKKHEIVYLARAINKICDETKCDTVIDFGSGLGYLDQQLFETTAFNVLGLECNENHYTSAKKRQRKYHHDSIERVKYIKHTVSDKSISVLDDYVYDKFPSARGFCIAGLHACADLTVDAINIFIKMRNVRSLIIMPCCYHRIQPDSMGFKNFPLSNCLKLIFEKFDGSKFMQVPFLRLATQARIVNNCKMDDLVFNLLSRAVLQLYGRKHNCVLKRKKRKAIKAKTKGNDFDKYIVDAAEGFSLVLSSEVLSDSTEDKTVVDFNSEELVSIWHQMSSMTFKKTAIYILLQNHLQPVFENFVLYDRICYLQENSIRCRFEKILNSEISPRCLSLIAHKYI